MRLSDKRVTDVIIRSSLYKDILSAITNKSVAVIKYETKTDETYRSDLISYRVYGMADLDWLVDLLLDREDRADEIKAGIELFLPQTNFIRDRIRYYEALSNAD